MNLNLSLSRQPTEWGSATVFCSVGQEPHTTLVQGQEEVLLSLTYSVCPDGEEGTAPVLDALNIPEPCDSYGGITLAWGSQLAPVDNTTGERTCPNGSDPFFVYAPAD